MKKLEIGDRINIYQIVEGEAIFIEGNWYAGRKDSYYPGHELAWNSNPYYMFSNQVKLVGCMVVKSLK